MEQHENDNGDYVRLEADLSDGVTHGVHEESVPPPNPRNYKSWKWWVKIISLGFLFGILAILVFRWIGGFFMKKIVVPILNWEMERFSPKELAVAIVVSMAVFPLFLLPSTPSMWIAGMKFGYGIGFLLVMAGVSAGASLPYFIGTLFSDKIHGWLERHPKHASVLRLAGEGNWFHQFKAVILIRISPFPYILFNYAVVTIDVKYCPYLLGSLVGMVPDAFIGLYSGILIRSFADKAEDKKMASTQQMIFDIAGFCAAVAATVTIGIYTKRQLARREEVKKTGSMHENS